MIQHTANLPHGYTATFSFEADCLQTEWAPHVPLIRNTRKLRRFLAAYRAARDVFMAQVATVKGGNILVLDVGADQVENATVSEPIMVRH